MWGKLNKLYLKIPKNTKQITFQEFFFLPYSANDLTNPNLLLCSGDKVSFNIATEKR